MKLEYRLGEETGLVKIVRLDLIGQHQLEEVGAEVMVLHHLSASTGEWVEAPHLAICTKGVVVVVLGVEDTINLEDLISLRRS